MKAQEFVFAKKTVILQLLLILALGAFLRFYGLSRESLWIDELSTYRAGSYSSLSEMFRQWSAHNVHPPGYYLLIWTIQKLWTDTEFALRLPSAISGVLAIPAIFLLGKRLFSFREGLIAAGLMAVLWCPIYYSQEAKAYQMLLLLAIIATFFWIDILRNLSNSHTFPLSRAFPYAVTAAICCYLNYSGLYLVFLHAVASLVFASNKQDRRKVGLIYLIVCLLYLPWLGWMLWQFVCNLHMISWIPQPSTFYFVKFLLFIFVGPCEADITKTLAISAFFVLLTYLIIIKIRYIRAGNDSGRCRQFLLSGEGILLLWLTVPFLVLFIFSLLIHPVLTERYLIISLPAAYLLLARAITALGLKPISRGILLWILLAGGLLHLLMGIGYYSLPQKQQIREAVRFLVEHDQDPESSLIVGYNFTGYNLWRGHYVYNYYLQKQGAGRTIDILAGTENDRPALSDVLNQLKPSRVWLISVNKLPDDQFLATLEPAYRCISKSRWRGSAVWLFQPNTTGPRNILD